MANPGRTDARGQFVPPLQYRTQRTARFNAIGIIVYFDRSREVFRSRLPLRRTVQFNRDWIATADKPGRIRSIPAVAATDYVDTPLFPCHSEEPHFRKAGPRQWRVPLRFHARLAIGEPAAPPKGHYRLGDGLMGDWGMWCNPVVEGGSAVPPELTATGRGSGGT